MNAFGLLSRSMLRGRNSSVSLTLGPGFGRLSNGGGSRL